MWRARVGALCGVALFAACASALEIEATVKKIDADRGVVIFTANEKDRGRSEPSRCIVSAGRQNPRP
jgi:hypothetical protein